MGGGRSGEGDGGEGAADARLPPSPPPPRRRRPHVLLFPFPLHGHITPFLALAHRLTSSSCIPSTLLLPPALYRNAARQSPTPSTPLLRFATFHDLPPHIDAVLSSGFSQSPEVFLNVVHTQLQPHLREFILHHNSHTKHSSHSDDGGSGDGDGDDVIMPPISCLVSDSFMPWTVEVTRELCISMAEMWTASATAYVLGKSVRQIVSMGLLPFKQGTQDVSLHFLPSCISTSRLGHLPLPILAIYSPSDPIFQFFDCVFEGRAGSGRVLVNSFEELEAGVIEALKTMNVTMTPIGPTFCPHSSIFRRDDEVQLQCLWWLDKRQPKSVVYVAFGSTGILLEKEIREVAAALEVVGQPFLWAICEGSPMESLPHHFRSGCLAEDKGLIVSWAPQRQVLGHESVGVFLSHCGWNSVLESLWNGVPIVGCPRMGEQNTNMWLLQEWGVGVPGVDTMMGGIGSVRTTDLVRALEDVMMGAKVDVERSRRETLRENVAEMATMAHAAMSQLGSSTKAYQNFVDELYGNLQE